MPISYNVPTLNTTKQFADPKNEELWLPGLFEEQYYNNIFPIDSSGNLSEQTEFSKKNVDLDDFTISLQRYYLFLYCLKSRPFLFESASKLIKYNNDEFLFTPELAQYLSDIQTNKIKNQINSSLTIELVKKYAIDKGLDFIPQKLSDFFDVAITEDFINNVSRKLSNVTYESVIKHTLYENLKATSFNFKEGNASGWSERAISLSSGKFEYFIDVEGGPDNKSYPVVCVLTKRLNKDTKEDILNQTNTYVSNLFAKKVGNECLARIIGKPGQFEDNYKVIPIMKGRKDDNLYYNTICVVYDLSKIILSSSVNRNYDLQSLIEVGLGFFTEYTIEIDNIDNLNSRSDYLSSFIMEYFPENSFADISYKISAKNKHVNEVYQRINLLNKTEIENTISQPIKISRTNIINSFRDYVQLIINTYKEARASSQYLMPFSQEDVNVYLHFDSFLNLLAITTLPKQKKIVEDTKQFSPFQIEKFNSFDLDNQKSYFSDQFYGNYLNLIKDVKNYSGRRVCLITKTLERILYNTFDSKSGQFYVAENLTSDKTNKKDVNLLSKINATLPSLKFNYDKEDFFIDESLIDKTIKIASLTTNYRENKYQSLALQTMAFYLINAENGISLLGSDPDVKKFGEVYHYPVLSVMANEEKNDLIISLDIEQLAGNFPDNFDIPQEILIVSGEVQKAFDFIKGKSYSLNDITNGVNNYIISNTPCLTDIIDLINTVQNLSGTREVIYFAVDLLLKLPIAEIISAFLESKLNEYGLLGEQKDPCKPLPPKLYFNPDDLFNSLEYLKDLYFRSLNPEGLIQGFIDELPKLNTLDFWLSLLEKIGFYILKFVVDFLLRQLFAIIRPYLEKWCSLDFDIFKPPFFVENEQFATFSPNILGDSFGSPAGASGALYDVQLSIDINVLIELSEIATKEIVYSKFSEEFSIEKTSENFQEIAKFFTDISPSVDLYELASLLRNVSTDYTNSTVLDSIKISDFKFKNLFTEKDDVINLFKFLGKYCDYRICYDLLSKSLEKYVGNICSPQQSRKKDYELILKDMGVDPTNTIRDQILDLEKQIDKVCSTPLTVNFDLLKNGPKLLANSLTPYMVMPFSTIVDFQKNVYEYELGQNLTDKQRDLLGDSIFSVNKLNNLYSKYNSSISTISSKYSGLPVIGSNLATNVDQIIFTTNNLKDAKYISDFNERKNKIKFFLNQNNIVLEESVIDNKIKSELVINPVFKSSKLYLLLANRKQFGDFYKKIVYNVEYLEKLKAEIQDEVENATNLDMQDDMDLFMSYINKLKE